MSMFQGIINNPDKDYHSYFILDPLFEDIGLGYYTSTSLKNYISSNKKELGRIFCGDDADPDSVNEALRSLEDSLLGNTTSLAQEFSIVKFDQSTNRYIYEENSFLGSYSNINELALAHDNNQLRAAQDAAIEDIVYTIQNSLSGCVDFKPQCETPKYNGTPQIHVFFKDKEFNSNERKITQKGAPVITDVPRRPTGGKYGWKNSQDIASSGIGVYLKPSEGGFDNPENTIAGSLRLSFNKALGIWESGTQQVLARLLTDLDPAKVGDIPELDNIDDVSPEQVYDPDNQNYMSGFVVGVALPLSVQNGNPNTFGPNTIATNNKKEKIRVVNRAPRKFKRGDLVICSLIDNEWVVQGFDSADSQKTSPTVKIGSWSFSKFIVDSDSFFKDKRYYDYAGQADKEKLFTGNVSPNVYETKTRLKYFRHLFQQQGNQNPTPPLHPTIQSLEELNNLSQIARLNIHINLPEAEALKAKLPELSSYDFEPSPRYIQTTAYDQLGTHMGGTSAKNLLGRTNALYAPDNISDDSPFSYREMGIFFGPAFPDGYSSQQVALFKAVPKTIAAKDPSALFFTAGGSTADAASISADKNSLVDTANLMFSDINDLNFRQLPAEVGVNSSGSPIEDFKLLSQYERSENLVNCYAGYLSNEKRLNWLYNAETNNVNDPIYGFNPVQPSRIQFSPLGAEFAVHKDSSLMGETNSTTQNIAINDIIFEYFEPSVKEERNLFGNMFDREQISEIVYGDRVKRTSEAPYNGPNLFPEQNQSERANLIGIIAAKNKFVAQKGASIVCSTSQFFGLNPRSTISGGQVTPISIIGGFITGGGSSNPIRVNSSPQWGSVSDNYDSFGTTTLHVRVFDQWPDAQTIYDGRYFAVLHFNPLPIGGEVEFETKDDGQVYEGDWNPENDYQKYNTSTLSSTKYARNVDKSTTSVDFRIPTLGHPSDSDIDNKVVDVGSKIDRTGVSKDGSYLGVLRPATEWRINPIRRGQLLTGGGFRYYRREIGLDPSAVLIENAGTKYAVNDIITFPKGGKAVVKTINNEGGITSIDFQPPKDRVDDNSHYDNLGRGYLSSDFATGGGSLRYGLYNSSIESAAGSGAKIKITNGRVYNKLYHDFGPQDRLKDIKRLTIPSNRGADNIEGQLSTTLTLEENADGKYDGFYFFHNDILHTIMVERAFIPAFVQYVVLEIGVG